MNKRDEIRGKVEIWLDSASRFQVVEALVDAWFQQEELTDLKKWHPFETAPTDGTIILGQSDGLFNGVPYVFSFQPSTYYSLEEPWIVYGSTNSRPFTHCHQRWQHIPDFNRKNKQ